MKNYQNNIQDKRIDSIERHTSVMNRELGEVQKDVVVMKTDLAVVKTDVSWLKKNYWVVAGASVGGLIAALFNLLIK